MTIEITLIIVLSLLQTVTSQVDGDWSAWQEWSACSLTCGIGVRTRTRACSNPAPQFGGNACQGADQESADCNTDSCPGKWVSYFVYKFIMINFGQISN